MSTLPGSKRTRRESESLVKRLSFYHKNVAHGNSKLTVSHFKKEGLPRSTIYRYITRYGKSDLRNIKFFGEMLKSSQQKVKVKVKEFGTNGSTGTREKLIDKNRTATRPGGDDHEDEDEDELILPDRPNCSQIPSSNVNNQYYSNHNVDVEHSQPAAAAIQDYNHCFLCCNYVPELNTQQALIRTHHGNFRTTPLLETFCKFLELPNVPYLALLEDERLIYCPTCVQQLEDISSTWILLESLQTKITELRHCIKTNLMNGYHPEAQQEQQASSSASGYIEKKMVSDYHFLVPVETRKKIMQELKILPETQNPGAQPDLLSQSQQSQVSSSVFSEENCPSLLPVSCGVFVSDDQTEEFERIYFGESENNTINREIPETVTAFQENEEKFAPVTQSTSYHNGENNVNHTNGVVEEFDDSSAWNCWNSEISFSNSLSTPSTEEDEIQDIKPSLPPPPARVVPSKSHHYHKERTDEIIKKSEELSSAAKEKATQEILAGKRELKIVVIKLDSVDASREKKRAVAGNSSTKSTTTDVPNFAKQAKCTHIDFGNNLKTDKIKNAIHGTSEINVKVEVTEEFIVP